MARTAVKAKRGPGRPKKKSNRGRPLGRKNRTLEERTANSPYHNLYAEIVKARKAKKAKAKASGVTTATKKRGRPKKAVVAVAPVAKRGRGRPKKVVAPVAKKRGRPAGATNKKFKDIIASRRAKRKASEAKIKAYKSGPKRRGRPPGKKNTFKRDFPVIKRGRGRPKGAKDKNPRKKRGISPVAAPIKKSTTPKLSRKAEAPAAKNVRSAKRNTNVRTTVHRTPQVKVGSVKATRGTLRTRRA